MVVGSDGYQLKLSKLAFSFGGGISMDYLQSAGAGRIKELSDHSKIIAEEIESRGK